jgi:AMP-polyphosphate phosphotransferase
VFEAAELGRKVSGADYKARVPALREELLRVQRELHDPRRASVIILFGAVDGAGKSDSVNLLNEWMDPRWLLTRAYGEPSDEESDRPEYWRFWRDLPPRGRIASGMSSAGRRSSASWICRSASIERNTRRSSSGCKDS